MRAWIANLGTLLASALLAGPALAQDAGAGGENAGTGAIGSELTTPAAENDWERKSEGIDSFVTSIVFDAARSNVTYAAGRRLYASWNGGESWFAWGAPQAEAPYRGLVVDSNRSGRVFATDGFRTLLSESGGLRWRELADWPTVLAIAPGNSSVLWGVRNGALEKSSDAGATWAAVAFPAGSCCGAVVAISESELYVTGFDQRLHHSSDGGASWSEGTSAGLAQISQFAVDRRNPQVLYAVASFGGDSSTGSGLSKSTDGGRTWTRPSERFRGEPLSGVAVSPADGRVYVTQFVAFEASPYNAYVSSDGGATFVAADRGLEAATMNGSIVPHPRQPCVAVLASNEGAYRTRNGGGTCP